MQEAYAYLATTRGTFGLDMVNVSEPSKPTHVSFLDLPGTPKGEKEQPCAKR